MVDTLATSWRGRAVATTLAVSLAFMSGVTPAAAMQRERNKDCSLTSVGLTPLNDLGTDTYMGAQGGLYPGGSNDVPDGHLALGLARAAEITPRDAAGRPDATGAMVFASIGFSNSMDEFGEFERMVPATANIAASVVVVNGAQGGQHILEWAKPNGRPWRGLENALGAAGVTAQQVQGVWVKLTQRTEASGRRPFPESALEYQAQFTTVVRLLHERLPNLQVAYVSSRVYGGYNNISSPSPEPIAYEEGFGVKWAIESQMTGDPALNADPRAGDVVAPWLAWGPYLWADGTTPRSDGLTWSCGELRSDGAHLAADGSRKVAQMLMDFLQAEPTAAWLFGDRELPPPPADLGEPVTSSTLPAAEPPAATVAADPVSTTTAAPPVSQPPTRSTTPPAAGATADEDGASATPPLVWALLGAGIALGIAGIVTLATRYRRKRSDT